MQTIADLVYNEALVWVQVRLHALTEHHGRLGEEQMNDQGKDQSGRHNLKRLQQDRPNHLPGALVGRRRRSGSIFFGFLDHGLVHTALIAHWKRVYRFGVRLSSK